MYKRQTLYGVKSFTRLSFCVDVKSIPVVVLIDIKTLPYSGVELTPVLGSKLPSSPPHIETDCVFGNNLLT